ncbi:GPI mannosyltransferase 2 [Exophiala dermatitidis]
MVSILSPEAIRDHPLIALTTLFLGWKLCIVVIALASPGIGYDSSTSLLFSEGPPHRILLEPPTSLTSPWFKFVRWDAIYFTHISQQGHVYEQEWAFGMGISTVLSWNAALIANAFHFGDSQAATLTAGLVLSNLTHWLSVIQLFALATALDNGERHSKSTIPFCAAALHIFSPAGIFLSAPYTESLFAFLSVSGFLGYVKAVQYFERGRGLSGCGSMILSGATFGAATFVRSNGILAGMPFLLEAMQTILAIVRRSLSFSRISRLLTTVLAGLLVAMGIVIPQFIAFREYCSGRSLGDRRPWCKLVVPSIFTWVQSHYWNVGLFRYWTLSNLPLFLLAAPTLWLLIYTAVEAVRNPGDLPWCRPSMSPGTASRYRKRVVMSLALPQLALAVLALTSYHVQIITRLSSGYPLWYIWLAAKTHDAPKRAALIIRWMIIYAMVQAGLYASFLPPA